MENSKSLARPGNGARLIKTHKPVMADPIKRMKDPVSYYEMISPERASEYLKRNHCNRPLRETRIKRYSRDMSKGRWKTTHQGIAFDRDGNLIDGQHRLHAAILANYTLRTMVTRDLPKDANEGVDNGFNRGVVDILHYQGLQADNLQIGLVRWMSYRVSEGAHTIKDATRAERIEFYVAHREAITYTCSMFAVGQPIPRMRLSAVLAVFARAYYIPKYRKRLIRAAEILITGIGGEAEEEWIIKLRNFLLYLKSIAGEVIRREIYLKTERALYAYLTAEEVLGNLRPASKELFPLPEEKIQNHIKGNGAAKEH